MADGSACVRLHRARLRRGATSARKAAHWAFALALTVDGAHYWDFDCRFGAGPEDAQVVHLSAITGLVDDVARQASRSFYMEILAKPGHRSARPPIPAEAAGEAGADAA